MNEYESEIPVETGTETFDISETKAYRKMKRYISGVFLALFWSWLIGFVVVMILQLALMYIVPEITENSWVTMGISIFHTIFTMLLFALFLPRHRQHRHPVTARMNFRSAVRFCIISCGVMFAGAFMGNGFSMFLSSVTGIETPNVVDELIGEVDFLPMLLAVAVAAPVFEELFFRKLLVDSLSRFGTVFCCVVSGLVFGLFHGNFYQFFYAFGLGMLLAFIYCIYGKIRYTIALHSAINIFGSFVPLTVMRIGVDYPLVLAMYGILYIAFAIAGIIFLVRDIKWFRCYTVESEIPNPFGRIVSPGFILFMIMALSVFTLYMI